MEEYLFNPDTLEKLKFALKNICNYCCKETCVCIKSKNHGSKWTEEQVNLLIDCIHSGNLEKMERSDLSLKAQIGKMCLELNQESKVILANLFKSL